MRLTHFATTAFVGLLASRTASADCPQNRPTDPTGFGGYVYSTTAKSYATPEGNGRIWWVETGTDAPDLTSSRPDGVPDAVATVGQVLEDSLAFYAQKGFRPPLRDGNYPSCASNGGDGRIDIYLVAFVGSDGETVTEECTTTAKGAQQCPGFILVERNFPSKGYATAQQGAQTVVAHELFHMVQDAYDAQMQRWWAEGTAQWAMKQKYPQIMDLEANLPGFFSQVSRPIDSPPSGAVAEYLYGAAIWPVFLGEHRGEDTIRLVMESIGAGNQVLPATDLVLGGMSSSLADDFGTFAEWNVATGKRASAGEGYAEAAKYPEVAVQDFPDGSPAQLTGVTAGFASNYFHATDPAPRQLALEADGARLGGYAIPVANGQVQLSAASPLPALVTGEAIVVLAGRSSQKTDVPWTLTASAPPDADAGPSASGAATSSSGGCSIGRTSAGGASMLPLLLALPWLRRRRRAA